MLDTVIAILLVWGGISLLALGIYILLALEVECSVCHGLRYTKTDKPCPRCQGRGKYRLLKIEQAHWNRKDQ
jgi:RecJ-like exonuclease